MRDIEGDRANPDRAPVLIKQLGLFAVLLAAVALNVFLLFDAASFEFGEHLTPTCFAFRRATGFNLVALVFLVQLSIFSSWFLLSRSRMVAILSVFPYWLFLTFSICLQMS
jgi:hypothetical protein